MPNARVAAAASGLPVSEAETSAFHDRFHITLGRELAVIVAERDRLEQMRLPAETRARPEDGYLQRAIEDLDDREDTLLAALSAFPSRNLAGAAIQLSAAKRIFDRITLFTDPDPAEERALRRLLWAAGNVVVEHAALDRATDGLAAIAGTTGDPWRDVHDVISEVFPTDRRQMGAGR